MKRNQNYIKVLQKSLSTYYVFFRRNKILKNKKYFINNHFKHINMLKNILYNKIFLTLKKNLFLNFFVNKFYRFYKGTNLKVKYESSVKSILNFNYKTYNISINQNFFLYNVLHISIYKNILISLLIKNYFVFREINTEF